MQLLVETVAQGVAINRMAATRNRLEGVQGVGEGQGQQLHVRLKHRHPRVAVKKKI